MTAASKRKIVVWNPEVPNSIRIITADEWTQAGVDDQKTLVWSEDHEHAVYLSDVSEKALEVLMRDGKFTIEEV